jgi:photosystem II stability/assembly factor-like uncharacterized protein
MKAAFALVISFKLFVSFVSADDRAVAFHNVGPYGGPVQEIVPDRQQKNLWYAISNQDLYRSTDVGRSWMLSRRSVSQVMIHPVTAELLAVSGQELLLSSDRGRSFRPIAFSKAKLYWHPAQRNILAAHGEEYSDQSLQLSTDLGTTWQNVSGLPYPPGSPAPGRPECKILSRDGVDVFFPPENTREIYLSLKLILNCNVGEPSDGDSLLLYSNDFGSTWRSLQQAKREYSFHWDPVYPDRAFVFNRSGLYRIGAGNMTNISSISNMLQLKSTPGFDNELFAVRELQNGYLDNEIIRSRDLGRTWSPYKPWLEHYVPIFQMVDDRLHGILAGSSSGIFYSNDTTSWANRSKNLPSGPVLHVSSSAGGNVVYLSRGRYQDFLIKSTNAGKSWMNIAFPDHREIHEIAVNPKDDRHVVLIRSFDRGHWGQLTVTRDGGDNWSSLPIEGAFGSFHPSLPNVLYFAGLRQIYVSNNFGASLNPLDAHFSLCAIYPYIRVDAFNPNVFFITDPEYGSLFKSVDAGKTVRQVRKGLPADGHCGSRVKDIAALPSPGSYLLLASTGSIFRTDDLGNTWRQISQMGGGLTYTRDHLYAADSQGSRFLAVHNLKLYESRDQGIHWQDITEKAFSTKEIEIQELTDPRQRLLYAATNRGVFRSSHP